MGVWDTDLEVERKRKSVARTVSGIKVSQANHESWSNVAQEPFPCWLLCSKALVSMDSRDNAKTCNSNWHNRIGTGGNQI